MIVNWLILASNLCLVFVTLLYVLFTNNLVKETIKQNRINILPMLVVNQEFHNPVHDPIFDFNNQKEDSALNFKIINYGNGNAFNLYLEINYCVNLKSGYHFKRKYKNKKIYPVDDKIPLKFKSAKQMFLLSNQINNEIEIIIIIDNLLANQIKTYELGDESMGIDYLDKQQSILIMIRYSDILHNSHEEQWKIFIKYDKNDNMIKYNDQLGMIHLTKY